MVVLVLVNIIGDQDTHALAEKVIKQLSEPFDLDGTTIHIGVSLGIVKGPDHGTDTATARARRSGDVPGQDGWTQHYQNMNRHDRPDVAAYIDGG